MRKLVKMHVFIVSDTLGCQSSFWTTTTSPEKSPRENEYDSVRKKQHKLIATGRRRFSSGLVMDNLFLPYCPDWP